jgi:NAD(P)-dependent dehydrogenase (short-subunit alcohol dehydrogenase family)
MDNGRRLQGKVAIVTGAGTGIGEAIAHKFALEGAKVVVAGLPDDPVDDVVKAIAKQGGEATGYKGDVADEAGARRCVQAAIDEYGALDVLVNNAGVFLFTGETDQYDVDFFDATIRNNVRSVFLMTKFALPHLQKAHGNIVNAGSESGELGIAHNTPYGGTKAFIHAFTKGVAHEQARYGVRVNCVAPGPIDTAWTHSNRSPMSKKDEKTSIAATPLGRRGTPEEVANVYCFLASDEASYVTGAVYAVDGGITISKGPVGLEADRSVRKEPERELKLEHSMDGLKTKDYDSSL